MRNIAKKLTFGAAAAAALILAAAGSAQADVLTGWVGPAGTNSTGVVFLNTSTIINSPALRAESKIYSSFGQTVPTAEIGVRARLFKSGALCEATTYRYNPRPAAEFTLGTTATCGSGWYNSHGFTAVWDGTSSYKEALTFPTNPLEWIDPTASPSARSANTEPSFDSGTNGSGQTFGSGESATNDAELPDLVAAIGDDGVTVGYVRKSDLVDGPAENPQAAAAQSGAGRTVPLLDQDGKTQLGTFTLR